MSKKVLLSWSGGKDAAYALHLLQQDGKYEVTALLTTLSEGDERVSMHGVRRVLLERGAKALGYPLEPLLIPQDCSDEAYGRIMQAALTKYTAQGVEGVVFGDLYLRDVRRYREERLGSIGMKVIFPLWGLDTHELAKTFIGAGFRAVVVCVDTHALDETFLGREYDQGFLGDLPAGVDPCGENGEFHTFVYDGPSFAQPVGLERGEKFSRHARYTYCDLLPEDR